MRHSLSSLQPTAASLSTVVVTATRPLTRQEDDKTIVDPEPIAAASTNAFEILKRLPASLLTRMATCI